MHVVSERLVLRPWRVEEADRLLDIQSRLEVMRWLGDGPPVLLETVDQARRRIGRYREISAAPPIGIFAVEVRATGIVAGSAMLLPLSEDAGRDAPGDVEVAWHLHPDSWGHGYATEAAGALLAEGFATGLPEIHALTHLANDRSIAVCRRLGMEDLGERETAWYSGRWRVFRSRSPERP
ncbi:MAG TPA: GNAT family N-acetyltransferase [Marmoricola sp.]|nr:GNAT family N-acetyltransferase [Marmoricola sp.]